jgi:hypothetical protein
MAAWSGREGQEGWGEGNVGHWTVYLRNTECRVNKGRMMRLNLVLLKLEEEENCLGFPPVEKHPIGCLDGLHPLTICAEGCYVQRLGVRVGRILGDGDLPLGFHFSCLPNYACVAKRGEFV